MKAPRNKETNWIISCVLGVSSIALPFLLVLVGLDHLTPSAVLALGLFTFLAAGASFISREKKKSFSLIGPALALAIPSIILIEPHLPMHADMTFTHPETGQIIRIVQKGKSRTYYTQETSGSAEWTEISESDFQTGGSNKTD